MSYLITADACSEECDFSQDSHLAFIRLYGKGCLQVKVKQIFAGINRDSLKYSSKTVVCLKGWYLTEVTLQ